jgi:hypothetical protein
MLPADRRHASLGPEVSWPTGYSDLEYRDGDYRYAAPQAASPPPVDHGQHPYAAFTAGGYGDDGYRDPGYQGPVAQDAGIAGTRTVRGFVDAGQGWDQPGYAAPGYAQSGYQQGQPRYPQAQAPAYPEDHRYSQPGYAGSSYAPGGEIEMAYPPAAASPEAYHGAESYQQPWDYDQPLRYDDEVVAYPEQDGYPAQDGYPGGGDYQSVNYLSGAYPIAGYDGGPQTPAYKSDGYNGSDYSVPGVGGSGYDLSGIIGTSDFEAVGYDEPSYDRLSYDDPRYGDEPRYGGGPGYGGGSGYGGPGSQFADTRFDAPRFDETRLDNLWLPGDDVRQEAPPTGYGNDGFGEAPVRSGYSDFDPGQSGRRGAGAETRFDMSVVDDLNVDHTRFDMPAYGQRRIESLRQTSTDMFATGQRSRAALLAPPVARPRGWAEDTSFDHFADLDLTDEPVPAAFTRTIERPETDEDTASRRAVGRRRGRSGDRRQWMALGAIAVVAAGAIGGVLMKYVFAGPSGPAHQIVAPASVDGYTRSATLGEQMHVNTLAQGVAKSSGGSASGVVSAVYEQGTVAPGSNAQIFMFVGGKLASADANASVTNFVQSYPDANKVSAGSLAGDAACTETHVDNEEAAMCVWFDNDTFGALVSPTMTTTQLAATLGNVRPSLELYAK